MGAGEDMFAGRRTTKKGADLEMVKGRDRKITTESDREPAGVAEVVAANRGKKRREDGIFFFFIYSTHRLKHPFFIHTAQHNQRHVDGRDGVSRVNRTEATCTEALWSERWRRY
jgi:hypothetical protein